MRSLLAGFILAALGCSGAPPDSPTSPLALSHSFVRGPMGVIVRLRSGNPHELAKSHGARFVYTHALKGFAANLDDSAIAALRKNPNVLSIEPDGVVSVAELQSPSPTNLDRIDQRASLLDGSYSYDRKGAGVHVYIIDSGINSTHADFTGRVSGGADFSGVGSTDDCTGHGTHVAGIAGGAFWGAAKSVLLHPVRVFGCSTSTDVSTLIAAIDWVTANRSNPAVANLSVEADGIYPALDAAISASIASGISYAIAAGNSSFDACTISPARVPEAITVGSSYGDKRLGASNWGDCVDLFAPGGSVVSAWIGSDTATTSLSGTSMAAPHVAGVMAMYLEGRPNASPAEVQDSIKAFSTKSVIIGSNSVNCNMLYSGRSVQTGHIAACGRAKPK